MLEKVRQLAVASYAVREAVAVELVDAVRREGDAVSGEIESLRPDVPRHIVEKAHIDRVGHELDRVEGDSQLAVVLEGRLPTEPAECRHQAVEVVSGSRVLGIDHPNIDRYVSQMRHRKPPLRTYYKDFIRDAQS